MCAPVARRGTLARRSRSAEASARHYTRAAAPSIAWGPLAAGDLAALEEFPGLLGNLDEAVAIEVSQQLHGLIETQRLLAFRDVIVDVAAHPEEIGPAILIEVRKLAAPTEGSMARLGHPGEHALLLKHPLAQIVKERVRLVFKISDKEVHVSVIVVIGAVHAHARPGHAHVPVGHARQPGALLERSISTVHIEQIGA